MVNRGIGLCLASAACFGVAAVFAKEAFAAGTTVQTLLVVRFSIAAAALWPIALLRRPAMPGRRVLLAWIGLGAVGYAVQSACYFGALTHLDASLVALLLYTYPAMVVLLAYALRRESPTVRKVCALAASAAGLVLLLGAGGSASVPSLVGVLLALGAAVTYTLYITVAATVQERTDPFLMSAVICTAAAATLAVVGAASGTLQPPVHPSGWGWMAALALVSTVAPVSLFLLGLRQVGPSSAALASCLEPVVTAASAYLVYGERLTDGQLVGAVVVLAAVGVLITARTRPVREAAPPPIEDRPASSTASQC